MDDIAGGVTFDHAGNTYTLRFSTGAMRRFEGATGKRFIATASNIGEDPSIDDIAQLMRWGLSDAHQLSDDAIDGMIDGVGLIEVCGLIAKALLGAMPQAKGHAATGGRPLAAAE